MINVRDIISIVFGKPSTSSRDENYLLELKQQELKLKVNEEQIRQENIVIQKKNKENHVR